MGQKVNPHGMRVGIIKDWQAKWYSNNKDFSKYLGNDLKIRKYLDKRLKDASVSNINIQRDNKKTEIVIYTTGATVEQAAKILKKAGAQNVYFLTISIGQGI